MQDGDISMEVFGYDDKSRIDTAKQLKDIAEKSGFFSALYSSYKKPKKEVLCLPKHDALVANNLKVADLGAVLRASIHGDDSNEFREGANTYPIEIKLKKIYREDPLDLSYVMITSKQGLIPITELSTIEEAKAAPPITHRDKRRFIKIDGFLAKADPGHVRSVLQESFASLSLPPGIEYKFAGNAEHEADSNREIFKAFVLAVLMTYMLLAAMTNSLIYPIAIAFTLFLSFIGVFFALFFLEETLNVASMLGLVMLVGLVVNNAILLIDLALTKKREGQDIVQALWASVSERFRPILMTSIAIIFGVLPQLFSVMPVKSSMGAVIIGGMAASWLFTFLFTPAALIVLDRIRPFSKKLENN